MVTKKPKQNSKEKKLIKKHDKTEAYESKLYKKYGASWPDKATKREHATRIKYDT